MASAKLVLDTRYRNIDLIDPKNGTDENRYPLVIRIGHQTKSRDIQLNYKLRLAEWQDNKVQRGYANAGRANSIIQKKYSIATDTLVEYATAIKQMDVENVRELVVKQIEKKMSEKLAVPEVKELIDSSLSEKEQNLWLGKYCKIHTDRLRKEKKDGTAKWFEDAVASLTKFNDGKDILIAKIDLTFLKDWKANHLSKGNMLNGFEVHHRAIRSLINKAIVEILDKKEYAKYPYGRFGFKVETTATTKRDVGTQVIDDIRKLEVEKGGALGLWHAKNYLLYMFNNRGMNFIDLVKLKREQLVNATFKAGKLVSCRMKYVRSKNGKPFSIKQSEEAIRILNEYNVAQKGPNDFIFPMGFVPGKAGYTNYQQQRKRVNRCFGELAEKAGHPKLTLKGLEIRHTWGTTAKRKGISTDVIQEAYGHDDPRTTKTYMDLLEPEVLDKVDEIVLS
jgi:integrase